MRGPRVQPLAQSSVPRRTWRWPGLPVKVNIPCHERLNLAEIMWCMLQLAAPLVIVRTGSL